MPATADEMAARTLQDLLRGPSLTKVALQTALAQAIRNGVDQGKRDLRAQLYEPMAMLGAELAGIKGPQAERCRCHLEVLRRRVNTLANYPPPHRRRSA
jgi:hypothetical protein